ncbi:hypothetical protein DMUE_6151 [Dictyocoela muelleri]|nr:hypothetical protein DMUE_6151 [Dictyocoela muelleri]
MFSLLSFFFVLFLLIYLFLLLFKGFNSFIFRAVQMASSNDATNDNAENCQQAIDGQTDTDKLAKCTIDLRSAQIDSCQHPLIIPPLLVITLIHNNKNYDV